MKASVLLLLLVPKLTFAEVMAVDAKTGATFESEKIITTSAMQEVVDKKNIRYEFSPKSAFEFQSDGLMKLLRGSAIVSSSAEHSLLTTSAKIDFIGKVMLSYDHKEKSTSAFVLEGQARMLNPHEIDKTLILDRFRGASMVVGDVFPQLIRQLDFSSVDDWMKGYAWEKSKREELLREMPQTVVEKEKVQEHLKETKLEDYFSSVEQASDDRDQPDYYGQKFADQDRVVKEANEKKVVKQISPEQAALIALPDTTIDLGFDLPPQFVSQKQKEKEIRSGLPKEVKRSIASVGKPVATARKKQEQKAVSNSEDPEVDAVLERLRNLKTKGSVVSQKTEKSSRAPASLASPVIPDPVYDFSQNF